MWELDHKESWVSKNWHFWTVVLEKTLESPLDCKEIKPVNTKGNQSWIFIGRTDAEAPILWPPDAKNWFIGKDPDAGKDCRQEEKGETEDEMVDDNHQLDAHEFEQAPAVREGQGRPGMLQSIRSQRVGHEWATELNRRWNNPNRIQTKDYYETWPKVIQTDHLVRNQHLTEKTELSENFTGFGIIWTYSGCEYNKSKVSIKWLTKRLFFHIC